jgi:hypothetical protein
MAVMLPCSATVRDPVCRRAASWSRCSMAVMLQRNSCGGRVSFRERPSRSAPVRSVGPPFRPPDRDSHSRARGPRQLESGAASSRIHTRRQAPKGRSRAIASRTWNSSAIRPTRRLRSRGSMVVRERAES